MRRIIGLSVLAASLFFAEGAFAQSEGGSTSTAAGRGLGLGVAGMLSGPAGISAAYDAGIWHLDSMLFLAKNGGGSPANRVSLGLGARFWFHLHKTSNADFSVGGGFGFTHNGPADADTVHVEGGLLLRAFIVSNVALSASAGLAINALDGDGVGVGGQFIGGAALHYYFD